MRERRATWIKATKSWLLLAKTFNEHNKSFGELVLHPEATDEMVLEAVHYRRETAKRIRSTRERLVKDYHNNMSSYNQGNQVCWNLLNDMQHTQL